MKEKDTYFMERAAAIGNPRALFRDAQYKLKQGVPDYRGAIQLLKRAVACGETAAYVELGKLYMSFESGFRNVCSAADMLSKGHLHGDTRAATLIGDLCIEFIYAGCSIEGFKCFDDSSDENGGDDNTNFMEQFLCIVPASSENLDERYRLAACEWHLIGTYDLGAMFHIPLPACDLLAYDWYRWYRTGIPDWSVLDDRSDIDPLAALEWYRIENWDYKRRPYGECRPDAFQVHVRCRQLASRLESEGRFRDYLDAILARYRKSAESGNAHSAFILGYAYETGVFGNADKDLAKEWYLIAADMAPYSFEAACRLASVFKIPVSDNVHLALTESAILSHKRLEQIDVEMYNAWMKSHPESDYAGASWCSYPSSYYRYYELEVLAKRGNPKAQYEIALLLIHGVIEGSTIYDEDGYGCDVDYVVIEQNLDAAVKWLRLAALQGDIWAVGLLGILDASWLVRGAKLGSGYACWKLCIEHCEDVQYYKSRFSELLRKNQTPLDLWTLGRLYEENGATDRAYRCFITASERKLTSGTVAAARLLLNGCLSDSSFSVYESLVNAAKTGDVDAVYWTAYCLENGRGCEHDIDGASRLYRLAADLGHVDATAGYDRTHQIKHESHRDDGLRIDVLEIEWYLRQIKTVAYGVLMPIVTASSRERS